MHVVLTLSSNHYLALFYNYYYYLHYFDLIFQLVILVIFLHLRCNVVLYVHNSSYSFILIFLKVCRYFVHGLTMCMWFKHYRQIIFISIILILFFNLWTQSFFSISDAMLYFVCATLLTVSFRSFWKFADILFMGSSCACGFNIIFKSLFIIIIIIIIIFQLVNSIHFSASQIQSCTLSAQILLQFYSDRFESLQIFCSGAEDMHVVLTYSSNHYLLLVLVLFFFIIIQLVNSVIFLHLICNVLLCVRNSSYSLNPIVLKVCRYFVHGLKLCMWF